MEAEINSFEDLYQQRKDWVESSRKNGFEDGILNLLTELYPDNAHFIYELLQNAEDARASEVQFTLMRDKLIFSHNAKRHFSFEDINSITSIGKSTKKDDVVQIGKFGVGFKAVFSYTTSPRVFSQQYNFEIRDLVIPIELNHSYSVGGNTVFEFPFNNPNKPSERAFEEVKNALDKLSVKTLLFLDNISRIKWDIEGERAVIKKAEVNGNYLSINKNTRDGLNTNTHWLKFSKPLNKQPNLSVSIAYKMEFKTKKLFRYDHNRSLGEQFKIVIDPNSNVSVYFPAEKESSNLKFNINAPFSSTVARDSVQNRAENNELIDQLTVLAVSSLKDVKEYDLLNASFLEVLPNTDDEIPDFYSPIRTMILKEFGTADLVPCLNDTYLPSSDVYESSATFRNVFDTSDLKYFVGKEDRNIGWLISCQGKRQRQFVSDLQIDEWGIEELFEFLCVAERELLYDEDERNKFKKWIQSKEVEWLKSFYCLLLKESSDESWDDCFIGSLSSYDILVTSNSKLSCADECYFPIKITNDDVNILHGDFFPKVSSEVDQKVQHFFDKIGVKTYGEREKLNLILEQYYRENATLEPSLEEHLSHINQFVNYYLNQNNKNDRSLFDSAKLVYVDSKGFYLSKNIYLTSAYTGTPLEDYFEEFGDEFCFPISDIYLNSDIELDLLVSFFKWVGCVFTIGIKKISVRYNPKYQHLTGAYGKWTHYGVNRDYTIDGLEEMLSSSSIKVSKFLLLILNESYSRTSHSQALYRPNGSSPYRSADSLLLSELKSRSWIPTHNGLFVKPSEITRHNVHSDFHHVKNKELAEDIELFAEEDKSKTQSDENQQKAKDLGFKSLEQIERAKWLAEHLSDEEQQRIIDEIKSQRADESELPNYTPRNPELRRERVVEEGSSSSNKQKEVRERSVAVGKSDTIEAAKEYLVAQYTDVDGVQICQVCQSELPFKKLKGGNYYFEAIEYSAVTEKHFYQNYLCLCPNHAAMYKHANSFKGNIVQLLEEANDNRIDIELGGERESIYFTDTHLLDIRALLTSNPLSRDPSETEKVDKTLYKEPSGGKQKTIDSFNVNFMERVKAIPDWNKAYLHKDEQGIWCLGSKNKIIIKSSTEQQAVKWWEVYVSKMKPRKPKLIKK